MEATKLWPTAALRPAGVQVGFQVSQENRSVPTTAPLAHICYRSVPQAIAWLTAAFGFTEHYRYGPENGEADGAQMRFGAACFMLRRARGFLQVAPIESAAARTFHGSTGTLLRGTPDWELTTPWEFTGVKVISRQESRSARAPLPSRSFSEGPAIWESGARVYPALPLMTCRTIGLAWAHLNMIFTRFGKSRRLMVPLPAPPQAPPSW